MGAVEVAGLTFSYGSQDLFSEFSWKAEGHLSVLEGPSGCGKTTLLRILAGQLEHLPAAIWKVPSQAKLILQDDGLFPWLTGKGNLSLIREWAGFESVDSSLQELSSVVRAYANQLVGTMSFGERRLLELYRALIFPSDLILLDEPLNFLDASKRALVTTAIESLAEAGVQIVVTSHYELDFRLLECQRYQFAGDLPFKELLKA